MLLTPQSDSLTRTKTYCLFLQSIGLMEKVSWFRFNLLVIGGLKFKLIFAMSRSGLPPYRQLMWQTGFSATASRYLLLL